MLRSWLGWLSFAWLAAGATVPIPQGKLHLRSGDTREWSSFPLQALGRTAELTFSGEQNTTEFSVAIRQRDVKRLGWTVTLNGAKLGALQDDERTMLRLLPVPPGTLKDGLNTLEIAGPVGGASDDIEITEIRLEPMPVAKLLSEATVELQTAGDSGPMPVKITVTDLRGTLVPLKSLRPGAHEAIRTGVLYTADGAARFSVFAGEYRIYASRGFEYSAPRVDARLLKGQVFPAKLRLRKEVDLAGHLSGDTHVHTYELSRHGDASVDERILTAAGEGLDFIVSTEHNRVDDYTPTLKRRRLDKWTKVIAGNEVTTAMGHFNIFAAVAGTPQPDVTITEWSGLMDALRQTAGVKVMIQNHPRDLHSNYRPFDPSRHLSSTGTNTQGRPFSVNAMEVVNSGAMSSDVMQLARDWLGLLNRGLEVAAIGASDTHTVDFVPIGQARTYIQSVSPQAVDLAAALAEGRNLVSYGLATQITVASSGTEVTVYGPSWSSVDKVEVYSNGHIMWTDSFAPVSTAGVKYRRKIQLDLPKHDTRLVAVASGPGVLEPFWEVRKPYQSTSPDWTPRVLGVSSAVWIDGDGDGRHTPPRDYAEKLTTGRLKDVQALGRYDQAVILQVLDLLRSRGALTAEVRQTFTAAPKPLRDAYELYMSEVNRLER